MQEQWTGSCADIPASLEALALEIYERTSEVIANQPDDARTIRSVSTENGVEYDALEHRKELLEVCAWMRDHASTLNEWSRAVRELYVRLDEGSPITNAQGVALAQRITERTSSVGIHVGPFDLPTGYLLVRFNDVDCRVFECGIAPDGRVSS